jgi:tRNA uridine 5-carboxymethylaminomethyl modification enzyme
MIDDLTTKEIDEPYRMFTSRAEFRLVLRQDNADERLMATGHRLGLVPESALLAVNERVAQVDRAVATLDRTGFPARDGAARFAEHGLEPVRHGATLREVLRRPGVRLAHLREWTGIDCPDSLDERVECRVKYEGYIDRQSRDVRAMSDMESRRIPHDFVYETLRGLSTEAREKLRVKRPETLGQASRIAGVRAADLSILAVYVERARRSSVG